MNLMVTPAGWATYTKGEETILFLYKRAPGQACRLLWVSGQGKFKVQNGTAR